MLDPLERLSRRGFERHAAGRSSRPAAERPACSIRSTWPTPIRDDTILVSVMLANNEIGVIQPLAEIAAICRQRGVPLHCDATQAVGKMPVDVDDARAST